MAARHQFHDGMSLAVPPAAQDDSFVDPFHGALPDPR
jgi:hypothetical protein